MLYLELHGSSPGPLYIRSNSQLLSCAFLSQWLKDTFAATGIDGPISSHSFRIGAATVAANAGIPDHLIQAMGRWKSNAYQLYIHNPSRSFGTNDSPSLSLTLVVFCPCHLLATDFQLPLLCLCGMVLGVTWDEEVPCPSWPQALLSPNTCTLETGVGGGLWPGCHGDLLPAEEIAALLACYLCGTYPPYFSWLRF